MRRTAAAVVTGLATVLVYIRALGNGFVNWDDGLYVYDNIHIRALTPDFFSWAFLQFHASNWHPLTWLSHALDYALWGLNPLGHHLTSVVLHGLNTCLVTLLVLRLLEIARQDPAGKEPGERHNADALIAAVTGLLFGLHPLHVESVAWVSERKDVLSAFFFLLSLIAYLSRTTGEKDGHSGVPVFDKAYLACLGLFTLSVMAKPMTVTLPVVLLILDWYPLRRTGPPGAAQRLLLEKAPFFVISLAAGLLAIAAQSAEGSMASLADSSLSDRLLVGTRALMLYLVKIVWPADLIPFYPYPRQVSFSSAAYLLPLVLSASISAGAILRAGRNRLWMALWACYVITLLPTLGIIQVGQQEIADRYLYLPAVGPFLFLGLSAGWVYDRTTRLSEGKTASRWLLGGCLAAAAAVLAVLTWTQIGIWRDGATLWSRLISIRQDIPRAYANRAEISFKAGRLQEALDDYTRAIAVYPKNPDDLIDVYHFDRAYTAQSMGRYAEALGDYAAAIRLSDGKKPRYLFARGNLYVILRRNEQAVTDYTQAIASERRPEPAYHAARAAALGRLGRYKEAEEDYRRAISLHPVPDLYYNLGNLYVMSGRLEEAVGAYTKAIELTPSPHPDYVRNRAMVLERLASGRRASGK